MNFILKGNLNMETQFDNIRVNKCKYNCKWNKVGSKVNTTQWSYFYFFTLLYLLSDTASTSLLIKSSTHLQCLSCSGNL